MSNSLQALQKHHKKIQESVTEDGKVVQFITFILHNQVSVKAIARTFASGKTEKLVYQVGEDSIKSEKYIVYCFLGTV